MKKQKTQRTDKREELWYEALDVDSSDWLIEHCVERKRKYYQDAWYDYIEDYSDSDGGFSEWPGN